MQLLGSNSDRLQVNFVTIDPERNTPAVLRETMRAFHPRFPGLHTDLVTTRRAADEFKIFYAKVRTGGSGPAYRNSSSCACTPARD
jgi:protein SCO1/2